MSAIFALGLACASSALSQDPNITRQPQSGLSAVGGTFRFDVAVSGTEPFSFQWLFNGSDLTDETNRVLTLTNLHGGQIGVYSLRVSNPVGTIVSSNASLSLITRQPRGGIVAVGEDFAFDVEVGGTEPFTFQWRRYGSNIVGATNPVLVLTNIGQRKAGPYNVRVTNPDGRIVSSTANLTVLTTAPRHIAVLAPVAAGPGACVETRLVGSGFENTVAFSISYNTNLFQDPVFLPARADAAAQLDTSQLSNGLVGVVVQLPPGVRFDPGDQSLGQWCFELVTPGDLLQAQLTATDQPVSITATNVDGEPILLSARVEPRLTILDSTPTLNFQSGLFEQQVEVANASAVARRRLEIGVYGLGRDSLDNAILHYNRHAFGNVDTNLDGVAETRVSKVQIARLDPGEATVLTMEFYSTDLVTAPDPQYVALLGRPAQLTAPVNASIKRPEAVRFMEGVALIEFKTGRQATYFIQYADPENPARFKTAFPGIAGTGSTVQWIDNGPPKTDSPPLPGRIYRVLATPPR